MATRERNGFGVPGWAVFMTQNLDRPFSVALKSAMEHARERKLPSGPPVSWREVLVMLEDPTRREAFAREHGEPMTQRVHNNARSQHAMSASLPYPRPEIPEGDLGASDDALADGRPVRVERRSAGSAQVTLFFSAIDLEHATHETLTELVTPVLLRLAIPVDAALDAKPGLTLQQDAAKHWIYVMTFGGSRD